MTKSTKYPSKQQRLWFFVFGCLQTSLVSGICFGWASIAGTLLVAPLDEGGAGLTMDQTTQIFAMAVSISYFAALLMGYVLDICGPRICSVISHSIIAVGCQIFALSQTYPYFALGTCMMAFGSPGIQNAVIHLANLFPDSRFLAMSSLGGSITIAFAILPIFDMLWMDYGIYLSTMFGTYVYVILLSAVGSLLLWPDTPFELEEHDEQSLLTFNQNHPTPEESLILTANHMHMMEAPVNSFLRSNSHHQLDRSESFQNSSAALRVENLQLVSIKDFPFHQQVFSWIYLRMLLVFVTTSFMVNFYAASLPTELADQHIFSSDHQHEMAKIFTVICSFGITGSILIGWLMDCIGLETCTVVMLVTGSLQMVIVIFFSNRPSMMILSFACYSLFRQFLFQVFNACISVQMGFKYFGILRGIGFVLSGAAQLGIVQVVHAVQGSCHVTMNNKPCTQGYWTELHVIFAILLVTLIGVPVMDHYYNVQVEKERVTLLDQDNRRSDVLINDIVETQQILNGGLRM